MTRLVLANARSPRQLDDGAFASSQFLHVSGRPAKIGPKSLRVSRPDDKVFVVEHAFISGTSRDVTPRDRFVFQKRKVEDQTKRSCCLLQPARHITPGQPADVRGASNPRVTHRSLGVVYLFALISPRLLLPPSISRLCLTLRASVFLCIFV